MRAPELLPCPFCGCDPSHNGGGNSVYGRLWWRVWCPGCCVELRDMEVWDRCHPFMLNPDCPPKECFARWNRRADLAPSPETLAKVIEALGGLLDTVRRETAEYRKCCEIPGTGEIPDEPDRAFIADLNGRIQAGEAALAALDKEAG